MNLRRLSLCTGVRVLPVWFASAIMTLAAEQSKEAEASGRVVTQRNGALKAAELPANTSEGDKTGRRDAEKILGLPEEKNDRLMKVMAPAAINALERFKHSLEDKPPIDRPRAEAAINGMFGLLGLPERTIRWFETAASASTYLATVACEACVRARDLSDFKIDVGDAGEVYVEELEHQIKKRIFDAAEAAFDSGWANGWPELGGRCQIAAGRAGVLEQMERAYIEVGRFNDSPELASIEKSITQAEKAIAVSRFDLDVKFSAKWAKALSPEDFARLKQYLQDNDELRDTARWRIWRHRTNMYVLVQESIAALAVDGPPPCLPMQSFARHVLDSWEAGTRLLWALPGEIVVVPRYDPQP